jgi:hypothetical protein
MSHCFPLPHYYSNDLHLLFGLALFHLLTASVIGFGWTGVQGPFSCLDTGNRQVVALRYSRKFISEYSSTVQVSKYYTAVLN